MDYHAVRVLEKLVDTVGNLGDTVKSIAGHMKTVTVLIKDIHKRLDKLEEKDGS